jgi:Uma2 family endonuclease
MSQVAERFAPLRPSPVRQSVPPLENGDNLTIVEFERRYDAMPPGTRAELIEGIVYMPPPVSHDFHGAPHFDLIGLLSAYRFATPGIVGGDNGSVYLDLTSLPQPDIYLMIAPGLGGNATVNADSCVTGSPELVMEISNSSASYDLHQKLEVYRRNGVQEYGVWRTYDAGFDFFFLADGVYHRAVPGSDGIIRSKALPGLWLNVQRLLAGDYAAVAADVQRGIASPEHAAFVAELIRRRDLIDKPASAG